MKPSELKGRLPNEVLESIVSRGIAEFTEPQELALENGLLEGRNVVVASPTASGKTLIAEIACASSIIARGRKSVYIAPMKALVSEKCEEFRSSYPYLRTVMSVGDLDSSDPWLSRYDMLFVSTEKFDSLVRHGADWIPSIGCVVFDEVHMLGDPSRGPTLELLMTKLRSMTDAQLIALSATIGNANEIAEWMGASLVQSSFRPVRLREGIVLNRDVYYKHAAAKAARTAKPKADSEELKSGSGLPEIAVLEDTLARGKQLLSFYSTRRNAEAGAMRMAEKTEERITERESTELKALSLKVLHALDNPTEQCKKLSALVEKGVAFHHAGLLNAQRSMIERACRDNLIKAVCATTTLSVGINLPAHTVLVKDSHRYNGHGSSSLGVNEVQQLFGRAGRPKYDTEGRALLIASSKENMDLLRKRYFESPLEPIDSSLGIAPVLRTHVLAFIAEDFLNTREAIDAFLAKTFYGFQYRNLSDIKHSVLSILRELAEWDFVRQEGNALYATKLGKRVSQLYIDPVSAEWMVGSLRRERDLLGNLFMICNTMEMRPYARLTEEAMAGYVAYSHANAKRDFVYGSMEERYGTYEPERAFSTALLVRDWLDEMKENKIIERYSTTPGFLYNKLTNADWMAYSAMEIAKVLRVPHHDLLDMNARLKYGIREELLDLVRLKGIGRARARLLFSNGIKRVADIRKERQKAERLLGKEVSKGIFAQL